MTTQTPATPGQPANRPDPTRSAVPPTVDGRATRLSSLGRAAWWCLAAWPVLFVAFVVLAQLLYPEGYDPADPSAGTAFGVFGGVMLLAAPLASLVLSAVDFHRSRARRALVPAWILLAAVAVWDVLFAREVEDWSDVNWWVFTPTVVVVATIVAAIAWPAPQDRTGS